MSAGLTAVRLQRGGTALPASAVLFAARLAGAAVGLVVQMMLARLMPPAALGLYFFATSLAAVLAVIAAAGYPQATMRFLTRYRALARDRMSAAFVFNAGRDVAVLAITLAAAVTIVAIVVCEVQTAVAVGVATAAVPLLALTSLFGSAANVHRRFLLASLPEFLLRPLGMLLVVAAVALLDVAAFVPLLLSAFVVLCLGVTIIQAVGLRGSLVWPFGRTTPSRARARLWRASAFPLVALSLFTVLFADVAIVAASPLMARGELASLAICLKISLLIGFAIQVVHQTVMPEIAEQLHRNHFAAAMARFREANVPVMGLMLLATMVVFALGDRLLAMFDPSFASAHHVLTILVASQGVRAMTGPASQMLTVLGRQKIVIVICSSALALLCASNAVLIPLYGTSGAAFAILLTITFWSVALSRALARAVALPTGNGTSALASP